MSPTLPAEPKPIVTRNSSEFNRDAYASIPSGELVVFAVQVLQADGSPALTEDIVSICFRFFPHSFALKNYFYWPDSALVARRLHDAREKGLLKGNTADGFEVKVQGRQAARHVAKALGVTFPVPPRVEAPAIPPAEKKEAVTGEKIPSTSPRTKEEEKKEASSSTLAVKVVRKRATLRLRTGQAGKKKEQKKKAVKPVVKRQAAKPKARIKPRKVVVTPVKKKPAPKPKIQPKAAPKKMVKPLAKAKVRAEVKKEERKKKALKPAVKPVVKKKVEPKVEKAVEKKQGIKKKEARAGAHPKQLTMPLAPPTAWKKAKAQETKPKAREEARQVKREEAAPAAVSKEERDKAAKVIKQIERSDAYQLYRRNGKRANIGEFDFRNMLFATMESSAETLKRNTDLFKRYSGIHFRMDLIAFLEFCEERFSALLISKAKVKGKR